MGEEFLEERKRALEEAFFAQHNAQLLRQLREAEAARTTKDTLRAASGITDEAVLERLLRLGVRSETLAALSLVPLVEVAWADRRVDAQERRTILTAASEAGLREGEAGYQLLAGWLHSRPGPELLSAWKAYTRALVQTLSDDAKLALKQELLGRAREVAEAAGGFLNLGSRISQTEQAMLTELEQVFA